MLSEYITVAKTTEVGPGEMLRVEVDGTPIILANVAGSYYALDAECTHRGGPLEEGDLDGTVLTCPLHAGQFDITTGEVLEAPPVDPLATYEVKVEGEEIRIAWP